MLAGIPIYRHQPIFIQEKEEDCGLSPQPSSFFYSQALANFNGWIHLSFAMKDEAFHFLNRAHVFFSLFKRWIGGRGDWLVSAVANTKMVLYNSIRGELRVVFGELDPGQTL